MVVSSWLCRPVTLDCTSSLSCWRRRTPSSSVYKLRTLDCGTLRRRLPSRPRWVLSSALPCVLTQCGVHMSSPCPISHAVCLISRIAATRSTYLTCRRVCIPCQPCHLSVHMYPCLLCHVWLSTAAARAHRDAREGAARHPDDHGAEDQGAHRRHRSRGGHRLDVALRGCPQSAASCARGPRAAAAGERVHSRAAELGDGEAARGSCLSACSIVDDAAVRCSWHRQWGSGCCAAAHPAPEPVHSRHCSW